MFLRLIVTGLLASSLWSTAVAATSPDALSDLINIGLHNAFSLQTQAIKEQQKLNLQKSAYAELLPAVTLSSGKTFQNSTTLNADGTKSFSADNTTQLRVDTAWTLWNNYQTVTDVQTARNAFTTEHLTTEREQQNYIVNLLDAYLTYQLALRQKEIIQGSLQASELTNEESQELVKAGAKTQLDAIDAEIEVMNTQRDLLELKASLLSAERNLRTLLNTSNLKEMPPIDLLTFEPYYMADFENKYREILANWKSDLASKQPDLKISRLGLENALLSRRRAVWNYLPTTKIVLSHEFNFDNYVQDNPTGARDQAQNSSIALTLSWPLWDWFTSRRTLDNAQKDFAIARLSYQEKTLTTETAMQDLLEQFELLLKTSEATKLSLQKAEKQVKYSQEMYRLGRINLLMMQQSTNRLRQARTDLASRLKTKYVLAAKLLFNTGYDLRPAPGAQ